MTLATKRKVSLVMMAIAIVAVSLSTWYYRLDLYGSDIFTEAFGNKLERSLKRAAGDNARTCGTVAVPHDSPTSNTCTDGLSATEGSFYTVYAVNTKDGVRYRGIARGADGAYKEFHWNPTRDEAFYIFAGPDPELVPCADPHALRKTWQNVVTCTADR